MPEGERRPLSKGGIALELLDSVRAENVLPGRVAVGDSGYGVSGPLRAGLAARGLHCVLGATGEMAVFLEEPRWIEPGPSSRRRPRRRHHLSKDSPRPQSLREVATKVARAKVAWRAGTKGPMSGRFAWVRLWPAHGWATGGCAHEEALWLLIEEQADGTSKFAFSNLPPGTSRLQAVRLWHERWRIEQDCQQMKEELGLDHFEGRSWRGFHHHAALVMLAFGFLALEQLRAKQEQKAPSQSFTCQQRAKKKRAPALPVITLPSIRRALQSLLAPLAKPDCPYCCPFMLCETLTE